MAQRVEGSINSCYYQFCSRLGHVLISYAEKILVPPFSVSYSIVQSALNSLNDCLVAKKPKRTLHPLSIPNSSLFIQEVNPYTQNRAILSSTALEWSKQAAEKLKEAKNETELKIFELSAEINRLFIEYIKKAKVRNPKLGDLLYTCRDYKNKELQALGFTTVRNRQGGKCLILQLLTTNPNNIRSDVNKNEPNRVQGAATAIISSLAQRVLKGEYIGLFVHSVDSVLDFYKKLGFEPCLNPLNDPTEGCTPLILTKKRIESLIFGI